MDMKRENVSWIIVRIKSRDTFPFQLANVATRRDGGEKKKEGSRAALWFAQKDRRDRIVFRGIVAPRRATGRIIHYLHGW